LKLDEVRAAIRERSLPEISPTGIGKYQWLIELDGVPAGWVTLDVSAGDRRHGKGAIGYTVGEAFRGKGVASAGVGLLVQIAFDPHGLNLERLEAVAAVDNLASRRVLEGNGFTHEGILRGLLVIGGQRVDHAVYGRLRTDRIG
jgi:ribosomal-protein-alanine N-acetyltransferase